MGGYKKGSYSYQELKDLGRIPQKQPKHKKEPVLETSDIDTATLAVDIEEPVIPHFENIILKTEPSEEVIIEEKPVLPPAIFFEKEKTFCISEDLQRQIQSTFRKFNLFVKQYDKYRLPE